MPIDRKHADALLTTTRGVRRRLDFTRPVPREVIEECVEIALQAPVGNALQKQHFIVIADAEKKRRIADLYRKACLPYLDAKDAEVARLSDGNPMKATRLRNLALARWQADTFHQVTLMVIAAKEGRVEHGTVSDQASFYGSILPAAWSFMLALRARGLGACWTTLHLLHEKEAGDVLGIPPDVTQAVLFSVGYYRGTDFKEGSRLGAREQIHWDAWGEHS
jgi:nitroreductase